MPAFKHGSNDFPILHDDGRLQVYKNHCGELFIEDSQTGVTLRLRSLRGRGLVCTTDARLEPTLINNTIGWLATPR